MCGWTGCFSGLHANSTYTTCTLYIQYMCTVHTVHVHCTYSIYIYICTVPICTCTYSTCTLYLQYMYTVPIVYVPVPTVHAHCTYSTCALYLQYVCTVPPRCVCVYLYTIRPYNVQVHVCHVCTGMPCVYMYMYLYATCTCTCMLHVYTCMCTGGSLLSNEEVTKQSFSLKRL